MNTFVVQIGNSDNKLTQQEWSRFVHDVRTSIKLYGGQLHFDGGSDGEKPWQNHAWVFTFEGLEKASVHISLDRIKAELEVARSNYKQDSIAFTEGETHFIRSPDPL